MRRIGGSPGWTRVACGEHEYTEHGFNVLVRNQAAEVLPVQHQDHAAPGHRGQGPQAGATMPRALTLTRSPSGERMRNPFASITWPAWAAGSG